KDTAFRVLALEVEPARLLHHAGGMTTIGLRRRSNRALRIDQPFYVLLGKEPHTGSSASNQLRQCSTRRSPAEVIQNTVSAIVTEESTAAHRSSVSRISPESRMSWPSPFEPVIHSDNIAPRIELEPATRRPVNR